MDKRTLSEERNESDQQDGGENLATADRPLPHRPEEGQQPEEDSPGTFDSGDGDTVDSNAIRDLAAQVAALEEALLRSRADYDNYRKRMARSETDLLRRGENEIVAALFPIMDNFELGFHSVDGNAEIVKGFRLIFDQLNRLLQDRQVRSFGAVGDLFDPHRHDALSTAPDGTVAEGQILQVIRRGYERNGQLLRPASVIVSSGPQTQ